MLKKICLQLGKDLKTLKRKRCNIIAKLRQVVYNITIKAALIEQDLEQQQAKENKFIKRIKKSR